MVPLPHCEPPQSGVRPELFTRCVWGRGRIALYPGPTGSAGAIPVTSAAGPPVFVMRLVLLFEWWTPLFGRLVPPAHPGMERC